MEAKTREFVRTRAGDRCEYRLLRQEQTGLSHHVEHIIAKQHGGSDDLENLALAYNRLKTSFSDTMIRTSLRISHKIPPAKS